MKNIEQSSYSPSKKITSFGVHLSSVISAAVYSMMKSLKFFEKIGESHKAILLLSIKSSFFKGSEIFLFKISSIIALFYIDSYKKYSI